MTKLSIIIPSYNGLELLKKYLPLVIKWSPLNTQIIVVDDASSDGSVAYLKNLSKQYSHLTLIVNQENKGFIYNCNLAAKTAKGDLLVLLNNDVKPTKNFLDPAIRHFKDNSVFAVSLNEQGKSWARIFWQKGMISHGPGEKSSKTHISAWASGGSAIFRKSMWEELGGFDPMLMPFYWEDFDIGIRAWKNGWKILWEPQAKVFHNHETTMSKLNQDYVLSIKERNHLLVTWKNIDTLKLFLSHLKNIIHRTLKHPGYTVVIFRAVQRALTSDFSRNTGLPTNELFQKFNE